MTRPFVIASWVILSAGLVAQHETSWSRFRGPNGSGIAETVGLPDNIGPETNVVWKTPLPPGHSSPVLSKTRIFLTAFRDETLETICLDRSTGKIVWRKGVTRARKTKFDKRNNGASPTPAVDGDTVVAFFPELGMIAYDHEGEEQWRVPLGPFNNVYGMGASPVIVGDRVFLPCDQQIGSYLLCVDKKSGDELWKVDRPAARTGHCTPIVWTPQEGDPQLILPGSFYLDAYDMKSGKRIWWVSGLSFEMKSVPVIHDGIIYINGYGSPLNQPGNQVEIGPWEEALADNDADKDGKISKKEMPPSRARAWFSFMDLDADGLMDKRDWNYMRDALKSQNGMLAIRAGGKGDMTEKSLVWSYRRSVPQLPSPLVYKGVLYMLNDSGGLIVLFKPKDGEVIVRGRLKDALDTYYASPVAGDGKVYIVGEHGKVSVLKGGEGLEPLCVSDLGENVYATPAIADGRIYLRTVKALYCFGKMPSRRRR